jgi:glycosyltransferase involved in cell wall biosynthesis
MIDKHSPVVSVIIPTYNRARFVGQAIQSVLDQTFQDFELIVVDDGSTDNTRTVVEEFTDPRIRYIHQENMGISGTRNTGIRNARARYIAFLDSDDIWLPRLLESQVAILNSNPDLDWVYARARAISANGVPRGGILGEAPRYPGEPFRSILYQDFVGTPITVVVRKRCLDRAGLFDETFHTSVDWELWLRMSRECRFQFVDKILACLRSHSTRTTKARPDTLDRWSADRVRALDKVYAEDNLPAAIERMKPIAYRNVFMHIGLRWLSVRHWRRTVKYFRKAMEVSRSPFATAIRCFGLVLLATVANTTRLGSHVSAKLIELRRRTRSTS